MELKNNAGNSTLDFLVTTVNGNSLKAKVDASHNCLDLCGKSLKGFFLLGFVLVMFAFVNNSEVKAEQLANVKISTVKVDIDPSVANDPDALKKIKQILKEQGLDLSNAKVTEVSKTVIRADELSAESMDKLSSVSSLEEVKNILSNYSVDLGNLDLDYLASISSAAANVTVIYLDTEHFNDFSVAHYTIIIVTSDTMIIHHYKSYIPEIPSGFRIDVDRMTGDLVGGELLLKLPYYDSTTSTSGFIVNERFVDMFPYSPGYLNLTLLSSDTMPIVTEELQAVIASLLAQLETTSSLEITSQYRGKVVMEFENADNVDTKFDVYNINGVLVRQVDSKGSILTIDNLPTGVYLIRGATDPSLQRKIIISN